MELLGEYNGGGPEMHPGAVCLLLTLWRGNMAESGQWSPAAPTDKAVREWMGAQGLPVNSTKSYFDEEVYAWRHEISGSGSPTLWIARSVLEDWTPGDLVAELTRLGVAERIQRSPKARFLVVEHDAELSLVVWGHSAEEAPAKTKKKRGTDTTSVTIGVCRSVSR